MTTIKSSGNPTDRKKRGDFWIILSFLVPLSVSYGTIHRIIIEGEGITTQAQYLILQWFPFQIIRGSGDWKTTAFQFLSPPGHPLYLSFSYLVLLLVLIAVFIRFLQYFQTQKGLLIESGVVGAIVSAAAVFEAIKIFLFRFHASELYLTHIGLSWDTEGVNTSGVIFPLGIVFLLLAAYREYKAFPIEFKELTSNIVRFTIIGLFIFISLFPIIWIIFVTLNVNDVLRAGVLIWPLAGDRPMTLDAWKRLFHFDPAPGHTLIEGVIFLIGAIIAFSLMVVVFIKRSALMQRVEILLDRLGVLKTRYWLPSIIVYAFIAILGIASYLGARLADIAYDWLYYQIDPRTGAITKYAIGNWFTITFLISTTVTIVAIVLASLSGYALSRFKFVGRGALAALILSTQVFPGIILVLPLYIMSAKLGLTGTLIGLGIAYSVIALPICTFLMKGYFDSIPADLEEQAMVDGCTRMQAYRQIIMPLALPGIASTFLFAFLAMYTEYLLALQIYKPTETEGFTISLAMLNVFQADITQRGVYFNDLAVFSLLVAIPILIGFVYLQRFLLKGMVSGAVKG